MAFLERYPFPPIGIRYQKDKLFSTLKFKIPPDGLRHTGITAIYHDHKNFGDTALEAGNSEWVIRKHYLNLWTQEQADKFWSIRPTETKDNMVRFA